MRDVDIDFMCGMCGMCAGNNVSHAKRPKGQRGGCMGALAMDTSTTLVVYDHMPRRHHHESYAGIHCADQCE